MKKEDMKKNYIKPAMQVYELQHVCPLLAGSGDGLNGVDGWPYGGGGDQPGR
jgi:hypothetical protein